MTRSFVFLNAEVKPELDAQAQDARASFERITQLVKAFGLERIREPYIKHLEGRIWEMRLRGLGGIVRTLYVAATGRRVVILRVFSKKTQRTPRREIDLLDILHWKPFCNGRRNELHWSAVLKPTLICVSL